MRTMCKLCRCSAVVLCLSHTDDDAWFSLVFLLIAVPEVFIGLSSDIVVPDNRFDEAL